MRTWRRRKENLGVFSLYAKRHKSVYISVNNNTNFKIFWILSIYTIWDGLSQKTISRYCPFNTVTIGLFYLNFAYTALVLGFIPLNIKENSYLPVICSI
jgi:hypothetical protein